LNLEFFVAKRLLKNNAYKNSVTATVIKIAIIAIALSQVTMLLAVAFGKGLQDKIREKMALPSGHISISHFNSNRSGVSLKPISQSPELEQKVLAACNNLVCGRLCSFSLGGVFGEFSLSSRYGKRPPLDSRAWGTFPL